MRNIVTEVRDKTKSQTKNTGHILWCTVNSVLTPVVYEETDFDGNGYYKEVFLTNAKKIKARESLKHVSQSNASLTEIVTTTTTTAQGTTTSTEAVSIKPVAVFSYDFGVVTTSDKVSQWNSTLGGYILQQTTADNRPLLGLSGDGQALSSAIYFKWITGTAPNGFMTLNNPIRLFGDFTIIFAASFLPSPEVLKKLRILGNSSNSDMFISMAETSTEEGISGYQLSISSATNGTVFTPRDTLFTPSSSISVATFIRRGDKLTIRENGVKKAEGTIVTDELTFDQVGKKGSTVVENYFNGLIYNISIYDGALDSNLEQLERDIETRARQAIQ